MNHKISILIRADVGRDTIDLVVSGCLNEETGTALAAQISKARSLDPAAPVIVDLSDARHVNPVVLGQLRRTIGAANTADGNLAAVKFLVPKTRPTCPCTDSAEAIS